MAKSLEEAKRETSPRVALGCAALGIGAAAAWQDEPENAAGRELTLASDFDPIVEARSQARSADAYIQRYIELGGIPAPTFAADALLGCVTSLQTALSHYAGGRLPEARKAIARARDQMAAYLRSLGPGFDDLHESLNFQPMRPIDSGPLH